MNTLIILGGGGGIVVTASAIIVVGRGIFKQISATEDNTAALNALAEQVRQLAQGYNSHEARLAVLEDRIRR